ncbi:MAG TPA: glycosyltransferase family 4 protein [Polyangiales bacterium]|nr:glycosyltransferase family 4 protein [Polyangiales bacterium]
MRWPWRNSADRTRKLQLSATRLDLAASGIGRVARLMARVLGEHVSQGQLTATALTLSPGPSEVFGIPVRSTKDSQLRFLAHNALASARADCHLYDFAGVVRAHPPAAFARPYLTWMHGIDVWENARPDHLDRLRAADLLLVNSDYTRDRATRLHSGLERARVCWLATETDEPAPPRLDDHPPTVTILSRIDASENYKGHRELIEAWPGVRKLVSDAQLVIAGDGSGRHALEQLARRSAPDAGIQFLGFVPDAQVPTLLRNSDVFAMPSRGEGFGLAYIEAMRFGIPVVASVHDAAPEINLHRVTGLNVDLTRSAELSAALSQLLAEPELARSYGAAGRARWAERFCFARFRERFSRHLADLIAQT